ncbi:hypothetical protein MTR_1g070430 [Medicago truncatula]|uniref:AIPP2-like SPOC-like domain-containing protein n=1 Tax=Medicago truncatula TaxID=3880 RepID=A0A072VLU5_MEDTR|nr:hypothetical protein MTR_1g070430 [Medicago truncatula]
MLEMKEKELWLQLQQKLFDEKKMYFELEMEQKRKSLIKKFRRQEEALEYREAEVNLRETKVVEKEQVVRMISERIKVQKQGTCNMLKSLKEMEMTQKMTSERIKVQNKGLENNLKSLKELKKTKKIEEKELEKEKESMLADRESLENSNVIVSSSNCSARPVSRLHNCTSKLYSLSKETNSVGTSYMAETSLDTLQCDNIPRKVNNGHSLSIDDRNNMESLTGGGLDDSQQLVPKVEEAKEFLGKTSEEIENESLQNFHTDHIKGKSGESNHTEKAIDYITRKRSRAQSSKIEEGEQNAADNEGHSDGITAGARKKKRSTVAPPTPFTGEKRYNLRRAPPRYNLRPRRHQTDSSVPSDVGVSSFMEAHLSTCHAVEVINFVSSFPEIITLDELPRSSIWPSQFRAQVTKEDIGLYFFAKDVNSLMNKMIKNDMALKGNLNGAELLIFPSNILPQEIQLDMNDSLFFLGVFQDRKEKKVDSSVKRMLEMKEKELWLQLQQKLFDEKKMYFELEMEQKRKSLIKKFRRQEEALEYREAEVNLRETKVVEKEQVVRMISERIKVQKQGTCNMLKSLKEMEMTQKMTSERIKVQNKGLENNLKSLKELKKTKKIEEKELEKEKESMLADRESLENSNVIVSSSNCSARPVSRLHNCTSKLYSLSKETNSVGTSYMAETSLESDVNIEKVKESASSPNIEGPLITLQERQIDDFTLLIQHTPMR